MLPDGEEEESIDIILDENGGSDDENDDRSVPAMAPPPVETGRLGAIVWMLKDETSDAFAKVTM